MLIKRSEIKEFILSLITPKERSGSLVVCFIICFMFGISQISNILSQFNDFEVNVVVNILTLIVRVFVVLSCFGLGVYLFFELVKEFNKSRRHD